MECVQSKLKWAFLAKPSHSSKLFFLGFSGMGTCDMKPVQNRYEFAVQAYLQEYCRTHGPRNSQSIFVGGTETFQRRLDRQRTPCYKRVSNHNSKSKSLFATENNFDMGGCQKFMGSRCLMILEHHCPGDRYYGPCTSSFDGAQVSYQEPGRPWRKCSVHIALRMCNVAGFAASLQTLEEGKKLAQNRKGVGRRCGSLFFPYSADHRNKMRQNT